MHILSLVTDWDSYTVKLCVFLSSADFLKIVFFSKKILQEYYHSEKQFGSRSALIFAQTVCKGYQQTTLVGKEMHLYSQPGYIASYKLANKL